MTAVLIFFAGKLSRAMRYQLFLRISIKWQNGIRTSVCTVVGVKNFFFGEKNIRKLHKPEEKNQQKSWQQD